MKTIIFIILGLAFDFTCYSQMYVSSSTATTVEAGVNVNVSTYCSTVPFYLGYTYIVNESENKIDISLCYHISPLLQETTSNHNLFVPTSVYSNYTVKLTIYSSISPTVCDYSTVINTGSIPLSNASFNETANEIKIFPNPTKDYLVIESENQKIYSLSIYNTIGQLMRYSTNLQNDLSDLNVGTYMIVLETENGNITKKIILQK